MKILALTGLGLLLACGSAFAQQGVDLTGGDINVNNGGQTVQMNNGTVDVRNGNQRLIKRGKKGKRGKRGKAGRRGRKSRVKAIICEGNEERTLRNVNISAKGPAIIARENCKLTLINANLAGGVTIRAKENAHVIVRKSRLAGKRAAVIAKDQAKVVFHNTVVAGKLVAKEKAKIVKAGGNTFTNPKVRRK